MNRLTDLQVLTIIRAGVLLSSRAEILADFEVELVATVARRFLRHGREAVVTEREWPVVERAVEDMAAALRDRMAGLGGLAIGSAA